MQCVGGEKNKDYDRKTKLCGSFCLQCFVLNIWKKERKDSKGTKYQEK
jgi:hypothetical protein